MQAGSHDLAIGAGNDDFADVGHLGRFAEFGGPKANSPNRVVVAMLQPKLGGLESKPVEQWLLQRDGQSTIGINLEFLAVQGLVTTGHRFQQAHGTFDFHHSAAAKFDFTGLERRRGIIIDDIPDVGRQAADRFLGANLDDFVPGLFADVFISLFDEVERGRFTGGALDECTENQAHCENA